MDNRKIIVSFYLVTAMVVWFLCRSSLQFLHLQFYQFRRIAGINTLREVLPVLLAAVVFFILTRHPKANLVLEEVVTEIKRVTWPGREDVVRSTTVVLICILIASFILAAFDVLWGKVITTLLHS